MPWARWIVVILLSLLVASQGALLAAGFAGLLKPAGDAPLLNEADAAASREPFATLIAGDDEALRARFAPGLDVSDSAEQFALMRKAVVAGEADEVRLLVWRTIHSPGEERLATAHEYEWPSRIVRVQTVLWRRSGEAWRVESLHVAGFERAGLDRQRLSVDGGMVSWAAVAGLAVVSAGVLATMWSAHLAAGIRRRWLWMLTAAVGVGYAGVEPASGEWAAQLISVHTPPARTSWSGGMADAWVVGLGLPLPAILFWIIAWPKRKRGGDPPASQTPDEPASAPSS